MKRIRMSAPRQFVCNDSNPVAKLIKVKIKVFRYEKTLTMQYSPLILLSVLINISHSTNWTDLSEDLVLSDGRRGVLPVCVFLHSGAQSPACLSRILDSTVTALHTIHHTTLFLGFTIVLWLD